MDKDTEYKYNLCLDELYSSFMTVKHLVKGKHDSEVRKPEIVFSILEELNVIPPSNNLIRVTGSKGKGTVSRLIARYLKTTNKQAKVGLIVSPEEFDHVDRIQIDGTAISYKDFTKIYDELRPILQSKQKQLKGTEYLSPFGIFLTIALKWFSQKNVTDFVIEGGRGVLFDEVGKLNSKVSVVTSILLEHPTYIGPTLEDIAKNKLSIRTSSSYTIVDPTAFEWYDKLYSNHKKENVYNVSPSLNDTISPKPKWFHLDQKIAKTAIETYVNHQIKNEELIEDFSINNSPSFGLCKIFNIDFYYEALISANSIDEKFWLNLLKKYSNEIIFLASLPDDKDLNTIHNKVCQLGGSIKYVTLEGTRGYLSYTKTLAQYSNILAGSVSIDSPSSSDDLLSLVRNIIDSSQVSAIYAFGTQTYIRLVKNALRKIGSF